MKKRITNSRILALLIAVIMVFGLLPVSVMAEQTYEPVPGEAPEYSLAGVDGLLQTTSPAALGVPTTSPAALMLAALSAPITTTQEARDAINEHNFDDVVQEWLAAWNAPRNAAIAQVQAQINELLDGSGITGNVTVADFVVLPSPTIGGFPPTNRTFRVTLNGTGGTITNHEFTVNVEFLHGPATGVNVTLPLIQPLGSVVAVDSSTQFSAAVLPAGIPQGVEWSVSGHSDASIDAAGVLTVGADVPVDTELTVTATRTPTNGDATLLSGSMTVTVIASLVEWAGEGTAAEPFLIGTAEELMLLAYRVNASPNPPNNSPAGAGAFAGVHFRVTGDIQLGDDWPSIGRPFVATAWVNPNQHQGPSFEGIFDGGGHTISFAHGSQPLFGAVWHNAVIRNLNIYSPYIAGHGLIAGVAAQSSFGTQEYVLIDNFRILSGTTIRGSGISGTDGFRPQQLDIRNSTVEAGVRIGFDADAGEPFDQNLAYFANTAGTGPGVGSFVSGLAGSIRNSVSYATVYGHPNVRNVGGLVGYKQQSMRQFLIENSHFHGTVNAPDSLHVGGILGAGYDSPNPRNPGAWHGQLIGSWAANNSPGENIRNSTVTGTIIGYDFVGGIVGGAFGKQIWSDGGSGAHHFHPSRPSPEHNVINNHFSGTLDARRDGTRNVGAIFGYVRSLNRNNNIAGNTFAAGSAERGIGHVSIIDTIHPNPTQIDNTTYFSTQGGSPGIVDGYFEGVQRAFGLGGMGAGAGRPDYYRTDDPLGEDADYLARQIGTVIPPVNRDALNAAIAAAQNRTEADYTPASWASMQTELSAAITVRDNTAATQAEVDTATSNLTSAVNALVPYVPVVVDRDALNAAIALAQARTQANYTPASWSAMQTALIAATDVRDNVNATQAAVDTAEAALTAAIAALAPAAGGGGLPPVNPRVFLSVTDPNARAGQTPVYFIGYIYIDPNETAYSILRRPETGLHIRSTGHHIWAGMYVEAINHFGEFDDGPLSGWMYRVNGVFPMFSASLYNLSNGDRVEWLFTRDLGDDVGAAGIFSVNRGPLNTEVARAEALVQAQFTPASWSAMQTALAAAIRERDRGAATQQDIDGVLNDLRDAIDALVRTDAALLPDDDDLENGDGGEDIYDDEEVTITVEAEVQVEDDGTVIAGVSPELILELIEQAMEEEAANITINITLPEDASRVEMELIVNSVNELAAEGLSLTVQSDVAAISIDAETLAGIAYGQDDELSVRIIAEILYDAYSLTPLQQEAVGESTAISLSILVGDYAISSFDGTITVTMPYTATIPMGDRDLLTVYFAYYDGSIREMVGARYYDAQITFTTNHFSVFFVSEWISPFVDVSRDDWYFRDVRFVYTHRLLTGSAPGQFLPDVNLSRDMLVTMLWRLEGRPIVEGTAFYDVNPNRWHANAIAWASANRIASGAGNNLFLPNDLVTREQVAVIFRNYARFLGQDTTVGGIAPGYADADSISRWAVAAMEWAYANGLITGRTMTTLAPAGTVTRAEAAAILRLFVEA